MTDKFGMPGAALRGIFPAAIVLHNQVEVGRIAKYGVRFHGNNDHDSMM